MTSVFLAVAGDEASLAALDVGERPEPVELQLEQPVAMVEGIAAALKGEWREIRERAGHPTHYTRLVRPSRQAKVAGMDRTV